MELLDHQDDSSPLLRPSRRYAHKPFPRYRFIPGKHPHPTANPKGHSYRPPGTHVPTVKLPDPENWSESEEYLFACDLYNHGYWWEAHEEWEGFWQLTDKRGAQGRFLQGLIQVSACHLKYFVGDMRGVRRLLATSLEHLKTTLAVLNDPEIYMGLRVGGFIDHVKLYYEKRLEDPAGPLGHSSSDYPYLELGI